VTKAMTRAGPKQHHAPCDTTHHRPMMCAHTATDRGTNRVGRARCHCPAKGERSPTGQIDTSTQPQGRAADTHWPDSQESTAAPGWAGPPTLRVRTPEVRTCPVVRDLAALGSMTFCAPQAQPGGAKLRDAGGANALDETQMTDPPEDLPSPVEIRKKTADADREFADARRYLSALCAEDNEALGALVLEIHRSGRAMAVPAAMAVQALDFAHLSADRLGGDVQKWLDETAIARDAVETEWSQNELGDEG
jgi:hypothetical protein